MIKSKYLISMELLLIVVIIAGCVTQISPDGKMMSSVTGELKINGEPELNQNFKLIYKIISISGIDASNVVAQIKLPVNVELVSGNLEWKGSLEKDVPKEIEVELKVVKVGQYEIKSNVMHYFTDDPNGSREGNSDVLYLDVSEKGASVSDQPPENNWRSNRAFGIPFYENEISANLQFGFTQLPELNKEVELVMKVIPKEDINRARLTIILHDKGLKLVKVASVTRPTIDSEWTDKSGVELLSDNNQISWIGDLKENEEFTIKLIVKATTTGSGGIYSSISTDDNSKGKVEPIQISVNKYGSTIDKDLINE